MRDEHVHILVHVVAGLISSPVNKSFDIQILVSFLRLSQKYDINLKPSVSLPSLQSKKATFPLLWKISPWFSRSDTFI